MIINLQDRYAAEEILTQKGTYIHTTICTYAYEKNKFTKTFIHGQSII